MLTALGQCLAGLVVMIAGAELMVRGGTWIAARLGISPIVIGLTVVAIGTSAPELAVGIDAVLHGNGDLAVGNIAGTNVVNILLILGLSAAIRALAISSETTRLHLPAIVAASFLLLFMAFDGSLSRIDGGILVGASLMYTAAVVYVSRRESRAVEPPFVNDAEGRAGPPATRHSIAANLSFLVVGIVIIVAAADWLVEGSIDLARIWGVPVEFIGLTIIAIGTSSPELVTTIVSTLRNQRDIAIGNLLGSSAYNILFILGVTCLFPSSPVPVARSLIAVDIPVMTAVALLCIPVFYSNREVSRLEGVLFVSAYMAYLIYLIVTRTG